VINHSQDEQRLVLEYISKDLILTYDDSSFAEAIVQGIIIKRVKTLLDEDKELLMSYLYRLDIPESKVQAAARLSSSIPMHESLGLLIYYRQLERVRTKRKYKTPTLDKEWDY
jgi:hypothetical protein